MSCNTRGGITQLKANLDAKAGTWQILDLYRDKFLLLTCSARALGAQLLAPARGAGSLGEFIC